MIIQKVPKKPTEIDLPDLSTTEIQKRSHQDFYDKVVETVETEEP